MIPSSSSLILSWSTAEGTRTTVADHAMAMLLALSRGFHDAWEHRRQKKWDPHAQSIVNLPGKTAGLLGLGAIGIEAPAGARLA